MKDALLIFFHFVFAKHTGNTTPRSNIILNKDKQETHDCHQRLAWTMDLVGKTKPPKFDELRNTSTNFHLVLGKCTGLSAHKILLFLLKERQECRTRRTYTASDMERFIQAWVVFLTVARRQRNLPQKQFRRPDSQSHTAKIYDR